ncbi:MAG TPA: type II toxin-antitoxin system VapC family toxin [Thermoanaerobaculia bacterium]
MRIPDLNVLLYAVDSDSVHHAAVHRYWEEIASGEEEIGFSWSVLLGFLRLSTNPAVFPRPLALDAALAKVDSWLSLPPARVITETPDHWSILRRLISEAGAAGNLTTDAHLAALAIGRGAVLVSCDGDFARFEGLRWENPLAPSRGRRRPRT